MTRGLACGSAAAVLLAACSNAEPPPSLTGTWSGTITCYKMDAPLSMTIDATTPDEATMAMGEGGIFPWPASVSVDSSRTVTIKSHIPSGDAQLLTGTLDAASSSITGKMDKQLCNKFTLTRAAE